MRELQGLLTPTNETNHLTQSEETKNFVAKIEMLSTAISKAIYGDEPLIENDGWRNLYPSDGGLLEIRRTQQGNYTGIDVAELLWDLRLGYYLPQGGIPKTEVTMHFCNKALAFETRRKKDEFAPGNATAGTFQVAEFSVRSLRGLDMVRAHMSNLGGWSFSRMTDVAKGESAKLDDSYTPTPEDLEALGASTEQFLGALATLGVSIDDMQ